MAENNQRRTINKCIFTGAHGGERGQAFLSRPPMQEVPKVVAMKHAIPSFLVARRRPPEGPRDGDPPMSARPVPFAAASLLLLLADVVWSSTSFPVQAVLLSSKGGGDGEARGEHHRHHDHGQDGWNGYTSLEKRSHRNRTEQNRHPDRSQIRIDDCSSARRARRPARYHYPIAHANHRTRYIRFKRNDNRQRCKPCVIRPGPRLEPGSGDPQSPRITSYPTLADVPEKLGLSIIKGMSPGLFGHEY